MSCQRRHFNSVTFLFGFWPDCCSSVYWYLKAHFLPNSKTRWSPAITFQVLPALRSRLFLRWTARMVFTLELFLQSFHSAILKNRGLPLRIGKHNFLLPNLVLSLAIRQRARVSDQLSPHHPSFPSSGMSQFFWPIDCISRACHSADQTHSLSVSTWTFALWRCSNAAFMEEWSYQPGSSTVSSEYASVHLNLSL